MTRKQEINAIYDRLCWMLNGAFEGKADPESFWEVCSPESLRQFINAANDVWQITDAGEYRLISTCYIDNWANLELVAEIIYDGGGRSNKPMDARKAK